MEREKIKTAGTEYAGYTEYTEYTEHTPEEHIPEEHIPEERIPEEYTPEEHLKVAKYLGQEIGFSKDIGMEVLEVSKGYCKGRVVIEKRHLNPLNTLHGGVFFTLADTICGIAAASLGYGGPTVRGDMDYLRAVRGREIVCTAKVTKTGKTLTWVEGIITDDTGREVCRTGFIYYRLKEARHFGFDSRE